MFTGRKIDFPKRVPIIVIIAPDQIVKELIRTRLMLFQTIMGQDGKRSNHFLIIEKKDGNILILSGSLIHILIALECIKLIDTQQKQLWFNELERKEEFIKREEQLKLWKSWHKHPDMPRYESYYDKFLHIMFEDNEPYPTITLTLIDSSAKSQLKLQILGFMRQIRQVYCLRFQVIEIEKENILLLQGNPQCILETIQLTTYAIVEPTTQWLLDSSEIGEFIKKYKDFKLSQEDVCNISLPILKSQ